MHPNPSALQLSDNPPWSLVYLPWPYFAFTKPSHRTCSSPLYLRIVITLAFSHCLFLRTHSHCYIATPVHYFPSTLTLSTLPPSLHAIHHLSLCYVRATTNSKCISTLSHSNDACRPRNTSFAPSTRFMPRCSQPIYSSLYYSLFPFLSVLSSSFFFNVYCSP